MSIFSVQKISENIKITDLYLTNDIFLYPYARYAFFELLQTLSIKTIYLPGFICRDMLAPINYLNIEYYFYDLKDDLTPILEDIICDAILMVNYFGFASKIDAFIEYKKKNNAILIEDNAHGFLSKDSEGKLLGTRGDFGLLSIRKTVFLPNGAALLINNPIYKSLDFVSSKVLYTFEDDYYIKKLSIKKKILHKYIGVFILLLRRGIRYVKTGSSIPLPDKQSETKLPVNRCITPILKDGVLNLDQNHEIERRRRLYNEVEKWAKDFGISPIFSLGENVVPFEFAFIDNGYSRSFEIELLKKGLFILPWPDLPNEVISDCPEFYLKVKVVPFLW